MFWRVLRASTSDIAWQLSSHWSVLATGSAHFPSPSLACFVLLPGSGGNEISSTCPEGVYIVRCANTTLGERCTPYWYERGWWARPAQWGLFITYRMTNLRRVCSQQCWTYKINGKINNLSWRQRHLHRRHYGNDATTWPGNIHYLLMNRNWNISPYKSSRVLSSNIIVKKCTVLI